METIIPTGTATVPMYLIQGETISYSVFSNGSYWNGSNWVDNEVRLSLGSTPNSYIISFPTPHAGYYDVIWYYGSSACWHSTFWATPTLIKFV